MEDLSFYFSNEDNQSVYVGEKKLHRIGKSGKCRRPKSLLSCEESTVVTANGIDFSSALAQLFAKCKNESRVSAKSCSLPQDMPHQLPPEVEEGNIEYKRKLVNPSPNRFEHLVTQMKWRLNEGGGEAIYRLGVDDDGRISGLEPKELAYSLNTLQRMAKRLNATLHPLRERTISMTNVGASPPVTNDSKSHGFRKAVEFLVRQSPSNNRGEPSVCVAVLGGVDAGKSTLISVLTDGELDNGRGRARLNLFRHLHEVQSGRTSSLSSELLGFDASGTVTNYTRADGRLCRASTDEIVQKSVQVLTLLDLAGHSKYQRTTLAGLSRCQPVGVLLVVSATTGLTCVGLEHAELAHNLGLPLAVVLSKIDQLDGEVNRLRQIKIIRRQLACKLNQTNLRFSLSADTECEASNESTNLDPPFNYPTVNSSPLFAVSAVTGEGLDELLVFLGRLACACRLTGHPQLELRHSSGSSFGVLPVTNVKSDSDQASESHLAEQMFLQSATGSLKLSGAAAMHSTMRFAICEVFPNVPGVRDPVVFGTLHSGQLVDNHLAFLGPDVEGYFHLVRIVSLKHNRQPHQVVYAGQTASVAVRFQASLSTPSSPSTKSDNLFLFENDENSPNQVGLCQKQSQLPSVIRRGMVLISHMSWSDWHGDLSDIPLKLTHKANSDHLIAVTWAFTLEVCCQLSVFNGLNTSPPVKPPLPVANQRVNVYAGCVAQAAIVVETVMTTEKEDKKAEHDSGERGVNQSRGRLLIRFTRHPEYLEVGRPVIITWAGYAKAVGRVYSLHDLVSPDTPCNSVCKLQHDGQLTASVSSPVHEECAIFSPTSYNYSNLVDQLTFFLSEPECDVDESKYVCFDPISSSLGDSHCGLRAESNQQCLSTTTTVAAVLPDANLKHSGDSENLQSCSDTTTNKLHTASHMITNPEQIKNAPSVPESKSTTRKRGRRRRRRKRHR